MRGVLVLLVSAIGATATTCHHGTRPGAPSATRPDTTAVGVIRMVGAAPREILALVVGTARVAIEGDLQPELTTLVGARVEVHGPIGPGEPPVAGRAITVRGYRILDVGGAPPVVGQLEMRDGEWWIDTVKLTSVPPDLARARGGKVWVTGTGSAGRLTVQLFGVIVPPAPPR